MLGDIRNGHVQAQVKHVTFEGVGVAYAPGCKAQLHLLHYTARSAPDPLNRQLHHDLAPTNGKRAESPGYRASPDYVARAATGASQLARVLLNSNDNLALLELLSHLTIASDTKTVVK
jgi:hypothetical protein